MHAILISRASQTVASQEQEHLYSCSRSAKRTASSPLFTIEGMLENTCIFVANVRSSCALSLSFTIVDTLQSTLYSSSQCEENFASSPPFTIEDTLHDTLYSCSRCEKRFCFISTVHNSRHTAEHLYSCIRCEEHFASSPLFTIENTLHDTLYSCSWCEKRFCFISTVHNSRHTAEHLCEHLCSYSRCEERFASSPLFTIEDTLHDTLYSCSRCGKRFASSLPFTISTIHNSRHTGEHLYFCSRCDKRFCFISNIHNRRHTVEHVYSCSRCEDPVFALSPPFTIEDALENNLYSCSRCEENTPALQALQLSIEAHTGTPPAADWKRPPGRPRINWLQQLEEDTGLSVGAAWIAGQDRSMWRTLRPSAGQAQQWVSSRCEFEIFAVVVYRWMHCANYHIMPHHALDISVQYFNFNFTVPSMSYCNNFKCM